MQFGLKATTLLPSSRCCHLFIVLHHLTISSLVLHPLHMQVDSMFSPLVLVALYLLATPLIWLCDIFVAVVGQSTIDSLKKQFNIIILLNLKLDEIYS